MLKFNFPPGDIVIKEVENEQELNEILQLQRKNIAAAVDPAEISVQGFVTAQHDMELLLNMHRIAPSLIACHQEQVIGYALVMTTESRNSIPVLEPMFDLLDHLKFNRKMISSYHFLIMGQVCIEKDYRGYGLFRLLYEGLYQRHAEKYDVLITEVATRNKRSINAHAGIGFQSIHQYTDYSGEQWEILVWDWNNSR
jgi:GNAT superfamily N-acetyltransferase